MEGSESPASWHINGVTQESADTASHAEEIILRAATHKLPNIPPARALKLLSKQI